ncbi:phosphatase PAP2 family protein [Bradyrhizobium viridifuturi]|uniref:phosphatase PAP2 family protein n=1 Tax=Bradyrhizobium viridifuturi TaxID=1654716 RepID=UPI000A7C0E1E|nr:phosphatase PAP2 family protein [Bradyrhizobium viridifuturi]
MLAAAYCSSFVQIAALFVLLAATRRFDKLWQLVFVFALTIVASTMFSVFWPAKGAFVYFDYPLAILKALPEHAGNYHLAKFEYFRNAAAPELSLSNLQGVVTFPSFHTCLALMTIFRDDRHTMAVRHHPDLESPRPGLDDPDRRPLRHRPHLRRAAVAGGDEGRGDARQIIDGDACNADARSRVRLAVQRRAAPFEAGENARVEPADRRSDKSERWSCWQWTGKRFGRPCWARFSRRSLVPDCLTPLQPESSARRCSGRGQHCSPV